MKRLLHVILTALIAITITGCGDEETVTPKDPLVKTQTVSLGSSSTEAQYPGSIKGRYETAMSFQISGRILQRYVQAGDYVHAGDILMSIDSRDVVQQSNQGEAQVAAAKAQLELATSNLNRYKQLYAQEAIPASVLDQYQTAYDAAAASYNQALAAAAQSSNALGYANLVAAADGVITSVTAEAGQVVAAGQNVITLVQTRELEAEINIPESRIADISIGQPVTVAIWSLNNQTFNGIIREISPMADAITRTYQVRISLPDATDSLKLGMTNSVTITNGADIGTANYTILPTTAIYQTDDTPNVWIVDKDSLTLSKKPVQVESFDKNQLKVNGLNNGDIVVTAGVHKLREGEKVRLAEGI